MKTEYKIDSKVSEVLFGSKVKKKLNNNVDKLVQQVSITSKSKDIVPIATGQTLVSVRRQRLGTQIWQLSSINHGGVRYDAQGNTRSYTTYQGAIKIRIPAYKNYGKNKWFEKAHDKLDNQGKVEKILLDIYD